jgi:hypothetical protein
LTPNHNDPILTHGNKISSKSTAHTCGHSGTYGCDIVPLPHCTSRGRCESKPLCRVQWVGITKITDIPDPQAMGKNTTLKIGTPEININYAYPSVVLKNAGFEPASQNL